MKEHILNQPKLALPGDPDTDVWSYYRYILAIPAIVGQTLLVSLQIPLADVSTTLRFYRVHSFPLLDPHTQQQFLYELENPYLAIDAKTDYYTLPAEAEVSLCVATHGKWCQLAQPMYTVDTSRHCVLALFLKQNALITKFCTIIHHCSTGVYATQLQPRIWVVSLAKSMLLRTECVTTGRDWHVLEPPYALVSLPRTCYAHISDSLFLPASTELSPTVNKTLISTYPHLAFHAQYHPMSSFRLFKGLNKTMDPEEVKALTTKLLEYDKLPMPQMTKNYVSWTTTTLNLLASWNFSKASISSLAWLWLLSFFFWWELGWPVGSVRRFRCFVSPCAAEGRPKSPFLYHNLGSFALPLLPKEVSLEKEQVRPPPLHHLPPSRWEKAADLLLPLGEYQPTNLAEPLSDLQTRTCPMLFWILWT